MMPATMLPQEPAAPPANLGQDLVAQLQNLGWIDLTALGVLLVFVVIGLWKGFVWQVSRVAILLVAWFLAGRFGPPLGDRLLSWLVTNPGTPDQQNTFLYVGYVLVFLGVLVSLSLLSLLVQKLVKSAGMTFFDRLGGGVVGIGTGACVVLLLLCLVYMFVPQSQLAHAADTSISLRCSQWMVDRCGKTLPDPIRQVFKLEPLQPAAPPQKGGQEATPPAGR